MGGPGRPNVKLSRVLAAQGLAITPAAGRSNGGRDASRERLMPWWSLSTTVLLAVALVVDVAAGRIIETIIIAILLVPSLAFLVLWVIASKWARTRLPQGLGM